MITQEQIARKLGISRQLVTFALAGYPQVSKESRARILEAAKKMGYRPNPYARALKRGRTSIIGLWVPDQISTHYTHVARELSMLLKKTAHELIISEIPNGSKAPVLSNVPVDGIVAVDALDAVKAHLESPHALSVPIVSVGADLSEKTDSVQVDLLEGTRAAMRHLIKSGRRRIVHATFVEEDIPSASRRLGYARAMTQAKLKTEYLIYPLSEQQRATVRQLIREYIKANGCPEAIFCHSDDVALGIYRGLCDLGIRIPDQLALVGCDGIQDTEYLEHPITTLVQPVAEMCDTAWKFLTRRIEHPQIKRQEAIFKPELSIRESSGPAKPSA